MFKRYGVWPRVKHDQNPVLEGIAMFALNLLKASAAPDEGTTKNENITGGIKKDEED